MTHQTALQREIMEAASQPYVWAGVQVPSMNGPILEFVLGTSGTTVATDVKVTIDPRFWTPTISSPSTWAHAPEAGKRHRFPDTGRSTRLNDC